MEKEYLFHYDLIHLSFHLDDWYGDFPVVLTTEEYDEMLDAHKQFYKSDKWHELRRFDNDDEYFLHNYCPSVHQKVRLALLEYAQKKWSKEVIQELDQAYFYLPDDIYYETDPEFFGEA